MIGAADYEAIVVGAGVVGLACAARLAKRWPGRVLVLERHDGICREGSSRNSEVVHAGIYYPEGSRKARTCVRGRRLLVERCRERGIGLLACGKVIVGEDEDALDALHALVDRATANGVVVRLVDSAELRRLEPGTQGAMALWSPSSGVVDSHAFAASLEAEARTGADVVFGAAVVGVERSAGYRLSLATADGRVEVTGARVVNAAGLGQDALSSLVMDVDAAGYRQHLVRGCWWSIAPRHRGRVSRLVYPVGRADDPGLGIHGCLDLGGGMRLGPDAEALGSSADLDPASPNALAVPEERGPVFLAAGQRLFPWLEDGDLTPDMAGLRPKLRPDGWADFVLAEESSRGLPGWVTLAGIESPGLTASMALAEEVDAVLA